MSQDIEEGWSLGSDNVPPWEKEQRERRFAEKRRREEMEKKLAAGKTDPSPQPPPARGGGAEMGALGAMGASDAIDAGRDFFDGVLEAFPGRSATTTATEMASGKLPMTSGPRTAAAGMSAGTMEVASEISAVQAGGTPALHKPAGREEKTGAQSGGLRHKTAQLWQTISGLTPDGEAKMSRSERRFAIRKLFREFERRAREALAEHAGDSEKDERTFLWTPLEAICIELGIARRKLSSLTKELTGMSAQETVDRIRAETVSANVKAKLAEKARATYADYFAADEKAYRKGSVAPVWKNPNAVPKEQLEKEKLAARAFAEAGITVRPASGWSGCANQLLQRAWDARRSRPGIGWSERKSFAARQQFSRELGFSSYARLYRACLLSSGKSPMELEHAAAVELFESLDAEFLTARERVREEVLKG